MRKRILSLLILFLCYFASWGQDENRSVMVDGELLKFKIDGGDTLLTKDLKEVSITSRRKFTAEEAKLYRRYRYYAWKVYPYATEAIKIFKAIDEDTEGMSKRQKKKYLKNKQKEMKAQFEDPLKNLSKTQGRILVHMIEKELDTPMYFLIKELRNGLHARYWTTLSSMYGYQLREGYIKGQDPIMDMVLDDFDITYPFK